MDFTCAAISDKTGKLALYSNGVFLCNSSNDSIKSGGQLFKYYEDVNTIVQGTIIIPYPEKDSLYLVLSQAPGNIPLEPFLGVKYFKYHIVDMSKNNGKGQVTLLEGKFCDYIPSYGKLTVCKHSNGIDYWLLVREHAANKFHRYLFTKNGITENGTQQISIDDPDGVGTAVYSPDGTKYAIYNNIGPTLGQVLEIFDFDRCTGVLSKPIVINYTGKRGAGAVFSADSRYLYIGMGDEIRQYDTKAADVVQSGKTVATSDGFMTCLGGTKLSFYNGQLAPNGKIYFNSYGCAKELHVIENPDVGGIGCNVKQHAITLPTNYYSSLCNFPNYRLGKKECMTATEDVSEKVVFSVYPNPNTGDFTLENETNKANNIVIYTIDGKVIFTQKISAGQNFISTNDLNNGIYFLQIKRDNITIQTEKISILK
jgi:Secretion system C-terminal sorting domain